jgi:hypothetical protein
MRLDFEELQYIVGGEETIQNMPSLKPMRPFSEEAVGFLSSLSKRVCIAEKTCRMQPLSVLVQESRAFE